MDVRRWFLRGRVEPAINYGTDIALDGHRLAFRAPDPGAAVVAASFVLWGQGRLSDVSSALHELLAPPSPGPRGARHAAPAVRQLSDLLALPQDAARLMDWLAQARAPAVLAWPTCVRRFDGSVLAVELIATAQVCDGGVQAFCALRTRSVMYDIAELVEARTRLTQMFERQQALLAEMQANKAAHAASELHWKSVLDGAGDAVWDLDVANNQSQVSGRWFGMLGHAPNAFPSAQAAWQQLLHPQDRARVLARQERYIAGQDNSYSAEYRMRREDGSYLWIQSNGIAMSRDAQGRALRVIGTHKDITEAVNAKTLLQQSESKLRAITDNTLTVMFMKDVDGRYLYANRQFELLYQFPDARYLGQTDHALFTREQADVYRTRDLEVIRGGETIGYEQHVQAPDGAHTYYSVKVPLRNELGEIVAVCGMACDINERKQTENQLRIAAVAFESPISMMITDKHQVIQRVNRAFVENTGFAADFAVGKTPRFLRVGTHDDAFYADMWRTIGQTGAWQGELTGRRQNGQLYPKWLTISAVRDAHGEISHYVGTETDMSERKNAEAALQHLNQAMAERKRQLSELLVQNNAARESERKHIAREVHDELGQILTALRMDTSFLAMRYGEADAGLQTKITGMRLLVDAAIRGVRGVAENLRPVALDMGFYQALEWVCGDFSMRTNVPCVVQGSGSEIQLDDARAIVVFRIVQESLTNITRYAYASRVSVRLWRDGNRLRVEIQDNGRGFDSSEVGRVKNFGLL